MTNNQITNSDVASKLYSGMNLKELATIERKTTLNTGITSIDANFGFPSGYYIIVGNPGVGKSWFALWLSRMFYRHNAKMSVYFSLEMPETLVRQRILQQWSDFTKSELEGGSLPSQAIEMLGKDIIVVDEFYADDTTKQTPGTFEAWIDTYYQLGYRVFHLDHFHELQGASVNDRNQDVVERWGLLFQQICKKYDDIWLFIFVQPNSSPVKLLKRNSVMGSKALTYKCDYFLSLNKKVSNDEIDGIEMEEVDRTVILYVDKTRYTEKSHIGFAIHFMETGNYVGTQRGEK